MILPAITSESARKLNELAQSINPILFWSCNFESTAIYNTSEEALFRDAIKDLYNFTIDTNCVLKNLALNDDASICKDLLPEPDRGELFRIVEMVQKLWNLLGQNPLNPSSCSSPTFYEKCWVCLQSNRHNSQPDNQEGFKMLIAELNYMGASLVRISREAMMLIREHSNIDDIIWRWVDSTLSWYCAQTSQTKYYMKQLELLYQSKASMCHMGYIERCSRTDLRRKIKGWIALQLTHRLDIDISNINRVIKGYSSVLDSTNLYVDKIRQNDPSLYRRLQDDARVNIQKLNSRLDVLICEREDLKTQFGGKEMMHFFDQGRFKKQLRETLERLQKSRISFTLLPQDFLYRDVEYHFDDVASPEGDF